MLTLLTLSISKTKWKETKQVYIVLIGIDLMYMVPYFINKLKHFL